jgi:hypothetical protein
LFNLGECDFGLAANMAKFVKNGAVGPWDTIGLARENMALVQQTCNIIPSLTKYSCVCLYNTNTALSWTLIF